MGERECHYTVLDVAPLLQARYAFISGGKSKEGAPVITFPDNSSVGDPTETDYKKLIDYLCNVPTLFEADLGFVVVVDRRQNGWSSVKTLLMYMADYFPYSINVVFILKPSGFFQRAFSDLRSKFKDNLSFQVTICEKVGELYSHIDPNQLTVDVGGEIQYDHNEWIEARAAIEKFGKNAHTVSRALETLANRYWDVEFPNDVEGTERIIREHVLERKAMIDDLTSTTHHGGSLLACVKGDNPEVPLGKRIHIEALEGLLVQLEETQKSFEEFWMRHESKLKQCLQLRQFEDEFKLIQYSGDRHIHWLSAKMDNMGDSISQIQLLKTEFTNFTEQAEKDIEKAGRLHKTGQQLMDDDHYAVDSIRPKCVELQIMCDQYRQLLRRRQEILTRSHDLHNRLEKGNKWCTRGVDLLATQQLEKFNREEGAQIALEDLEQFMATSVELKLSNPKEFRTLFESLFTPETKAQVQSLLQRIEDVQGMCEKRRKSLRRLSASQRPVVPVLPEPVIPTIVEPKRPVAYTQSKSVIDRPSRKLSKSSVKGKFGRRPRHNSGSEDNNNVLNADESRVGVISVSLNDLGDLESAHCKQRQILAELIDTEKLYVSEMYDIIRGYYFELDNPHIQHIIPTALSTNKDILFGNIDAIYRFHNDYFLNELVNCLDDPTSVGQCFLDRREEFKLYSIYCQNKPKSEALRHQIRDDNPFFKECQRKLGHKLPLSAYLLKPVQRITKYQLLLKEMLKCSEDDNSASTDLLQDALEAMLDLLKHVNDLMHQVAITGFTGNLGEQGRLLMQGSFHVWTDHKKDKIRDFRFKAQQRHIFLYEKAVLMCKKKEDGSTGQHVYEFKNYLMTSQIGITETVKGERKFEIWLRGREEVYVLQASGIDEKDDWCREIKRVLMMQFDQLQENKKNLLASKSEENLFCKNSETSSDSGYCRDSWTSSLINTINTSTLPLVKSLSSMSSQRSYDDDMGWSSSEFSNNSEEETSPAVDNVFVPNYKQQFSALSDYTGVEKTELRMTHGDTVEFQI